MAVSTLALPMHDQNNIIKVAEVLFAVSLSPFQI